MVDDGEKKLVAEYQFINDLRPISFDDLYLYIETLQNEIERVRLEIQKKKDLLGSAETIFKNDLLFFPYDGQLALCFFVS